MIRSQNYIYNHSSFHALEEFARSMQQSQSLLIQVFSGIIDEAVVKACLNHLSDLFPTAAIIGATTTGEIIDGTTTEQEIIVSLCLFDNTHVQTIAFDQDAFQDHGETIAKTAIKDDTKAIIAFSAGLGANPSAMFGPVLEANQNIIIAGGISGDNNKLIGNWVFEGRRILKSGMVTAVLSGDLLHAENALKFNWEPVGQELTITKADKNVVYEINDRSVVDMYEYYFGDHVKGALPLSSSLFPLVRENDGMLVSKVFIQVGGNGSAIFTGEFQEGDRVRFAAANTNMLMDNSYLDTAFNREPEALYIYSCGGRKSILGNAITEEIAPFQDITRHAGFFTYGEFFSTPNGHADVLNLTMTMLSLSETDKTYGTEHENKASEKRASFEFSSDELIRSLTHFNTVLLHELEDANKALREKSDELERLNGIDGLTGIHNRRYLEGFLKQAWSDQMRQITSLAVMMVDVDFFKPYNDHYGHQEGDKCLIAVAECLKTTLHRASDLVARYGGEEFCVVIKNDAEAALKVGENLRAAIENLNIPHKQTELGYVTVSIGISAKVPTMDSSIEDFIAEADKALYTSKRLGRNRVTVY